MPGEEKANKSSITLIDLYTEIRQTIAQLTDIIANMNTLTSNIHQNSDFEDLFQGIEHRMTTYS